MKITCQACQAKYTIADEKVLGKIVKIRCKKCGATIVVNGSNPPPGIEPATSSQGSAPPAGYDAAAQAGQADAWTVNVADGDQRTLTREEIVTAYRNGAIGNDTYCWKDGMNDWLPLQEIEQLLVACAGRPASVAPLRSPSGMPGRAQASTQAGGNGSAGIHAAAAPAAARRAGGRAPGADLFGGVAQAGSDEDVLTSAPAGMPQVHDDPARLTGARHENSVLFSLNALTSKGGHGDRPPPVAGSEQSGLIDIRQLSAQMGRMDDKKKSRVDDIMNLAGGGAFSPSLASPVLAPPPIEEYSRAAGLAPTSSKNKGLIILALGVGAFVIVGAVGGAMMLTRGKGAERDDDKAAGSANATELASPSASIAMNAPSAASGATGSPNDNPSAGPAAQPSDSAPAATPPVGQTKGPSSPAKEAKLPTTSTPAKDTSLAHALAAPAVPPPAAPAPAATADQPFNMGEAKAKLGAIASSVQACKKGDGPTGSGRVVVTFAPSGAAQSAVVSGPPFEGTPTGACVSGRFRGAHVPSFTGSPFSVSKSFSIN